MPMLQVGKDSPLSSATEKPVSQLLFFADCSLTSGVRAPSGPNGYGSRKHSALSAKPSPSRHGSGEKEGDSWLRKETPFCCCQLVEADRFQSS
ncbi:hypothetical protein LX36DRAFT_652908 [Colletotrichum falcatum]|nr:hypothetical protein LX36DRAFT_652908 [Colletotrichum falcatum]